MKYFNILFNVILVTCASYGIFQIIPTLISSNNSIEFWGGVAGILLFVTFIIARFIDMVETFKKGENNE
jgi:hypothetical protein